MPSGSQLRPRPQRPPRSRPRRPRADSRASRPTQRVSSCFFDFFPFIFEGGKPTPGSWGEHLLEKLTSSVFASRRLPDGLSTYPQPGSSQHGPCSAVGWPRLPTAPLPLSSRLICPGLVGNGPTLLRRVLCTASFLRARHGTFAVFYLGSHHDCFDVLGYK